VPRLGGGMNTVSVQKVQKSTQTVQKMQKKRAFVQDSTGKARDLQGKGWVAAGLLG
jgi:hypothetical protein